MSTPLLGRCRSRCRRDVSFRYRDPGTGGLLHDCSFHPGYQNGQKPKTEEESTLADAGSKWEIGLHLTLRRERDIEKVIHYLRIYGTSSHPDSPV
jgi:hypothetical protein